MSDHDLAGGEPREDLHLIARASSGGHQTAPRHAAVGDKYTRHLTVDDQARTLIGVGDHAFADDDAFAGRPKLTPDPALREHFQSAIGRAETLSHTRLVKDPKDRDALFALTLSSGLQADYAALIEKRNLASLHFTKEASASAQQLLAVCHDCYDALLATGFSKYIIGSMSAPVRWILKMGGLPSDKQGGIADLQTTAEHGHYLAPFARILLSIAYVREKDKARAVRLLSGLQSEFPRNTLFQRQIAHLQASH